MSALARLTLGQAHQDLEHNLLSVACLAARLIPGADGVGVTLLDDDGRTEMIVASTEFVSRVDAIQYGMGEGPCITAAQFGRTVHSDALGEELQWPRFGPRVRELDVHSSLSVPLLLRDERALGSMNVYAHARAAFGPGSIDIAERFAAPAAISIQNARALAQAHRLGNQLTISLSRQSAIDQALGVVMGQRGCTDVVALEHLLAVSRAGGVSLTEAARSVLGDLWNPDEVNEERPAVEPTRRAAGDRQSLF